MDLKESDVGELSRRELEQVCRSLICARQRDAYAKKVLWKQNLDLKKKVREFKSEIACYQSRARAALKIIERLKARHGA